MLTTTRKVDDRSRVVLPEGFAGQTVVVESVTAEEVRVRIVRAPRRRPPLAELLSAITPDNTHAPIDFGPPRGGEAI